MRLLKLRVGNILCIVLLLAVFCLSFLTIACDANSPNVLMFLWNGETSAEKGFKDAMAEELPDQKIKYTAVDTFKSTDRLKELIDSTDESHYKLIYTYGSTITSKVIKNFKTTPIVFNIVFDPIGYKIIESWDEKQPNLTGVSNSIPIQILVQKMQEVFGKADIGLVYNPLDKNSVSLKEEMEGCLIQSGAELLSFEFRENFNALSAFLDSIKSRVKCIYLPTEYLIVGYIDRIFSNINQAKIPTCVTGKAYLERGGLLCISAEYYEMGKIAGRLAAQVLKGAKPSDIPIKRPSESDVTLYVNSAVLKKLNMQLPEGLDIKILR